MIQAWPLRILYILEDSSLFEHKLTMTWMMSFLHSCKLLEIKDLKNEFHVTDAMLTNQ